MKITHITDKKGTFIKLDISQSDYEKKIEKTLNDYRKRANIPGFRKGQIPLAIVQKQYGKAVMMDEINKIIQHEINTYITEKKLNILGGPLPKESNTIDWDAQDFSFEFEVGLTPEITVDLKKKSITHYVIDVDQKSVDEQVKMFRRQLGKTTPAEVVEKETDELLGTFSTEDKTIDVKSNVPVETFDDKYKALFLKGVKKGDVVALKTKNLFKESHHFSYFLSISMDEANKRNANLVFTIEDINHRELAEMNQEFFDKVYGKDQVKTEQEMRDKIKTELQEQFVDQADQKLFGDVIESLIENTKIALPEKFLKRWIRESAEDKEKFATEKALNEEYQKTEKGLRYQLIENKVVENYKVQITPEELKTYAKDWIKKQMAIYGKTEVTDEELEGFSQRVLANKDEVKRLYSKLMSDRLLQVYKQNISLKQKHITYKDFLKEAQKQNN